MLEKTIKTIQAGSDGQLSLNEFTKEGDCFRVFVDEKNRIILEPLDNIPDNEKWIYENPEIFEDLKQGMEQSQKGEVKSLGSFAEYLDE